MDQLEEYEDHKKFLYTIFKKENQKWATEQEEVLHNKIQREKKKWVEFAKLHNDLVLEEDQLLNDFIKNPD